MFNESVMLFEDEIQPAFWEALSKAIEDWVNNPEWIGESDKYIKISPLKWRICSSEEEGYTAATFDWSFSEGNQRSYYLADLCGFGQDEMGFRFCVRRSRNLGASLELFAPERAANRRIPIAQAHIAPQVAGAVRDTNNCGPRASRRTSYR